MAHSRESFFRLQSDDSNVSGLTVESCGRSEFETFLELPHCLPGDGWDKGPHMGLQDEGSYRGQQDEGLYRGLQDEGPYRGQQDEGPYRGQQDEGLYRCLQDEGLYRGQQDEEPYRGQQDEGLYRGLQDEGPYRRRQSEEPARGLQDERPYRGLQDEGPYRGLHDERPYRGLQDEGLYRGLQDEGPYRRRQSEEPYRGLQNERPDRGLQDEGSYRGQQDEGPYRGQQDEGPYRGQQDGGPYRGLQDERPYRGLQDEEPYRGLQDERPYRGLQDEGPYRGLQDERPYRGLQDEGLRRGLQDEGPYRRRQSEEPYRGLQDERPDRGLQDEGPDRGLQDEGPYRGKQDEGPYRGQQDEGPYRGQQDGGPYRRRQSEEPYRGQQDEKPYRGFQDEGPYRGQQDEGSYRRQQDHFPARDWDPNLPLRNLPLSMQEKRYTRDQRQQQRLSIGCWESWRQSQRIARRRLREQVVRTMCGLQPWRKALHTIEGKFGVGVKAYFTFLRYLLYLNLIHCLFISGLALTPVLLYGEHNLTQGFIGNDSLLDLFFLTGFVDRSPVFYRFYSPVRLDEPCLSSPLLFLLAIASLLTLSIISVVRRTVIGYKHTWMLGSSYNHHFSYMVFCGWDFCTQVPESAVLQHSFIRNDIKLVLEEERFHQRVSQRTFRQWVQLYFLRGVLNFLVIVLLSASFYLIYYATKISQDKKSESPMLSLLVEYLPPITITMVNFLLPHLFRRISGFEDYSLTVQVNITLVRSIILKLACLAIFLIRLQKSDLPKCWENQFGKEMYRLVMFDFLACCLNAVLVEWPRKLLVERYPSCSLLRAFGKQTFLVPFNVLDLVYNQTVTWMGLFYCPLLAHISLLKLLFVFYIKKFVLFRCCEPAQKMFRGSQSSFQFTLLLGLLLTVVALGINANTYLPSSDCGPFADNRTVFNMTATCVGILPDSAQKALRFFISEAFALLLILVEIVFLTSFVSQGRANRRAIEGLKDILVMCSADKRFLVKKHSAWLRTLKTSLSAGNSEDACRMEAVDPSEIQPPFTRSTSAPCGGAPSSKEAWPS